VLGNAYLSPQNGPILDLARSAQPGQGRDDHALANLYVVGHLHQIVDLGSIADAGRAKLPPIDAGVRPDFNIGSNLNRTEMRNSPRHAGARIRPDAKALGPDDGPLMKHRTLTKIAAGGQDRVGTHGGPFAYRGASFHHNASVQYRPDTDFCTFLNHGARSNMYALADDSLRMHQGGAAHARWRWRPQFGSHCLKQ
jgi:hypothetical protein